MFDFKRNCCDGIYNSIDVHFTKACDNNCGFCIDKKYNGFNLFKGGKNMYTKLLRKILITGKIFEFGHCEPSIPREGYGHCY